MQDNNLSYETANTDSNFYSQARDQNSQYQNYEDRAEQPEEYDYMNWRLSSSFQESFPQFLFHYYLPPLKFTEN